MTAVSVMLARTTLINKLPHYHAVLEYYVPHYHDRTVIMVHCHGFMVHVIVSVSDCNIDAAQ